MVFGYSTNAYVKYSLQDSLKRIADLGFGGVEIMCDRPHLYPPDFGSDALDGLKAILAQRHLRVTNLNSFTLFAVGDTYLPSWIEPDKARRDIRVRHTLECLDVARALGAANISVPPGGPLEKGMTREEAFRRFYAGLDQVLPTAEALGVKVLVEPEPDLLMERTAEFIPFIREIRSPMIGLNFDIGHFFCAGEDPTVALEELFEWIGHMHVEDIAATREHNHLIAGRGAIDFTAVFGAMARLGYKGDISLELYPYVDTPDEAGRESRAHLLPFFKKAGLSV
ncbi:MAG: sugar phosphate isomerase/epimerase [Desulfosarcina sp.]|nr:sugar phosphate isomerase/epimerase [Desulfobacterales bacterium]